MDKEKNEDLPSLERMELILAHPNPSGKDLQMYANGNQQTVISVRMYFSEPVKSFSPEDFYQSMTFYQLNTNQPFGKGKFLNGGKVVTSPNLYKHGVFTPSNGSNSDAFSMPDNLEASICEEKDNCYSFLVFFMANEENNYEICASMKYNGKDYCTCKVEEVAPVKITAIHPLTYDPKHFVRSAGSVHWSSSINVLRIWASMTFSTTRDRPAMVKFYFVPDCQGADCGGYETSNRVLAPPCYSWNDYGSYYGIDLACEQKDDPKKVFYTEMKIQNALGIPMTSKSTNRLIDFVYTDEFGNSGKVPVEVCFGDACR